MSITDSNDKVIIIGAGIGGLALAQFLRKQNIPFEIFERDESAGSRAQGWAIALVECLPDLRELLPTDLGSIYSTSVNAGVNEVDYLAILDATTGQRLGVLGNADPGAKGHLLRAGRAHLRNHLWQHIPVSTGKQFSHYTNDTEGGVTAFFKDGSSSHGSILVGADGASSHVRTQLLGLPAATATLSPYMVFCGGITLTKSQFAPVAEVANAGFIAGRTGMRLAVGRRSIAPDGESADYFFYVCARSDEPEKDRAWARTATQAELYARVLDIARGLDEDVVARVIRLCGPENMVVPPIVLREVVPLDADDMPRGRVTVLGDAAHAMTPFRGAGANTAVQDAVDLARLIAPKVRGGVSSSTSWEQVVFEYNNVMVERGRKMVLSSRAGGDDNSAIGVLGGRANAHQEPRVDKDTAVSVAQ